MSNEAQSPDSDRALRVLGSAPRFAGRQLLALAVVLLFYLLIVSPDLSPSIHGIAPDDEAKYLDSGRSLVGLQLRELAWGPLV